MTDRPRERRSSALMRLVVTAALLAGGLVARGAPALAATSDFDYQPGAGRVGTVISINGTCDPDEGIGDAIGLYRTSDGALVDARVQLGLFEGDPTMWSTTLV